MLRVIDGNELLNEYKYDEKDHENGTPPFPIDTSGLERTIENLKPLDVQMIISMATNEFCAQHGRR